MMMLSANKWKLSDAPKRYWDFIHKYGDTYQSRAYLECLESSGTKVLVIEIMDGEEVVGGSAVKLYRNIFGFAITANTFFGPVVCDVQRYSEIFHCFIDKVKSFCLFFNITVFPEHAEIIKKTCNLSGWVIDEFESLHWDISPSIDLLWKELTKGKKSGINRGRREGVIIEEIQTADQAKSFHRLYAMSMGRSSMSSSQLKLYEALVNNLRPKGLMAGFLALHPTTNQPIAGRMLLLGTHNEATLMASGHDYELRNLHGVEVLMWHCIEFLKSRGVTKVDFQGLPKDGSPRAAGIRKYKFEWTGNNGMRCPSFTLRKAPLCLNSKYIRVLLRFPVKLIKAITKPFCAG